MRQTKAVEIARFLQEEIEAGKYGADGRLPSENALAMRYEVSRKCVRNALSILEGKAMISRRRGAGTFVNQIKRIASIAIGLFALAAFSPVAFAGGNTRTNPPSECKAPDKKCGCAGEEVSSGCIKVNLDIGETTPWTGSMPCALKIFADSESPGVFTCESLYAVLGGYTFNRLGQRVLNDGATPAEVVMSHPNGEAIHFVFKNGESIARPDPGVHVKMDERLMMVDAEGWAWHGVWYAKISLAELS